MRARTTTAVFSATVLGAVALGTAVSMSAATDGLGSDSILAGATVGDVFSGSTARQTEDPDAPIRTGRWAEDAAPVELAGGPAPTDVAAAAPPPEPILLSRSVGSPRAAPSELAMIEAPIQVRQLTAPLSVPLSRVSWTSPARQAPVVHESRINLSVSDVPVSAPGSGLDIGSAVFSEPVGAARRGRPLIDIKRLTLRIGASDSVKKKGRWFVFAAGSGEAFGLNLVRDPLRGWKPAGWSVENLAEFGKAQLGIGWRKGSQQLAASVARREISAYGLSREDTIFGISFTVSGQAPAKTRYEQRLPKAQ
ncbi:MAG: hypothetical protein HY859_00825 [Caulobacterales bacterium]|nr:hypothetical protein [Caulobacterales bacterium]